MELEELARIIRTVTQNALSAVLVGSPALSTKRLYETMTSPKVGDLVMETTTFHMTYRPHLDGLGHLLRVTQEPVVFSDPDFVWDEEKEETPHPTETCTYIRTLDGREYRWTNASFIVVPDKYLRAGP